MKVKTKKSMRVKNYTGRTFAFLIASTLAVNSLMMGSASALSFTNTYVRLDRMRTGTTSSVRVVFTTSASTATEDNIRLNFNGADTTSWTGSTGSVNATQTVATAACATETGTAALPTATSLTAAGATSIVTVSGVSNLTASTAYCFDLTSTTAVTLPTVGEYHPLLTSQTGATVVDNITVALRVVSDDQITVTANVPPAFNFQLDANTTAYTADLTPGTKRQTTARTFTVNTNAKTGWVAWMRNADANGLYSVGVAKNIAPTTPGTAVDVDAAASTEQYVWGVSAITQGTGLGVTSATAVFDATGATNDGTGVDTAYRQVASGNGTTGNAVVTVRSSATISGITPAASDYTDVVQVVGAGQF